MSARRVAWCLAPVVVLAAALAYLFDPPWIAAVTSGMGPWVTDRAGARYRWTNGRASFYVPSDAVEATIPMRAPFSGLGNAAIEVHISVDDRPVTELTMTEPDRWVAARVILPKRPTRRRHRRVEVRVNRTFGASNLGVQIGELTLGRGAS